MMDGIYELDIDVNKLQFTHHHLFTVEHMLCAQMLDLYRVYAQREQRQETQHFDMKVS